MRSIDAYVRLLYVIRHMARLHCLCACTHFRTIHTRPRVPPGFVPANPALRFPARCTVPEVHSGPARPPGPLSYVFLSWSSFSLTVCLNYCFLPTLIIVPFCSLLSILSTTAAHHPSRQVSVYIVGHAYVVIHIILFLWRKT